MAEPEWTVLAEVGRVHLLESTGVPGEPPRLLQELVDPQATPKPGEPASPCSVSPGRWPTCWSRRMRRRASSSCASRSNRASRGPARGDRPAPGPASRRARVARAGSDPRRSGRGAASGSRFRAGAAGRGNNAFAQVTTVTALADYGIADDFIRHTARELEPFGARIAPASLTPEQEQQLKKAVAGVHLPR